MPFSMVRVFQEEIIGHKLGEKRLLTDAELKLACNQLREEVEEFEEAHDVKDFIGAIDANLDIMYFAMGNLHKMGLTPDEVMQCFTAVNHCNMTKRKGVVERRGDGSAPDAVKPEGWIGPEVRIADILGGV